MDKLMMVIGYLTAALGFLLLLTVLISVVRGRLKVTREEDEDGWSVYSLSYTPRSLQTDNTQEDGS